jgi:hypothetical protein
MMELAITGIIRIHGEFRFLMPGCLLAGYFGKLHERKSWT